MKTSKLFVIGMTIPLILIGCKKSSDKNGIKVRPGGVLSKTTNPQQTAPTKTTDMNPGQQNQDQKIFSQNSASACYQELCGNESPIDLRDFLNKASVGTPEQQLHYNQHIHKLFTDSLSSRVEMTALLKERVESIKDRLHQIELSEEQKHYLKALIMIMPNNNFIAAEESQAILNFAYSEPEFKLFNKYRNKDIADFFLNLTTEKDLKIALKEAAQKMRSRAEKFNKVLGSAIFNIESSALLTAEAGKDLNYDEITKLASEYITLSYFETLVSDKLKTSIAKVKMNADTVTELVNSYKPALSTTDQYSKAIDNCKAKYFTAINISPSKEQNEKLRSVIKELKQIAKNTSINNDSQIMQKIDAISIYLPRTADEIQQIIYTNMSADKKRQSDFNSNLKTMNDQGVVIFAVMSALGQKTRGDKLWSCEEFVSSTISDRAEFADSNDIYLSWYSSRFLEKGVGIAAHEIAHILEKEKQMSESTKSCLIAKQNQKTQYLSEDFADMKAAQMLRELEKTGMIKAKNFACDFRSLESEPELSLEPSHNSTEGQHKMHSTAFRRALTLHLESGKTLGQACQGYLENAPKLTKQCQ